MAKDDYQVIVCKILKYLYEILKKGESPDTTKLNHLVLDINESYWNYIIEQLVNEEYIQGLIRMQIDGRKDLFRGFENIRITPKGIEYLTENSTMKKITKALPKFGSAVEILTSVVADRI